MVQAGVGPDQVTTLGLNALTGFAVARNCPLADGYGVTLSASKYGAPVVGRRRAGRPSG